MSLVGNGFTTSDARTGQRLQVNVVVNGGDDLNFTAATCGEGADTGFCFFNCGEGKGSITLSRPGYQTRIIDAVFPIPENIDYAMEPTAATVPIVGIRGQFFTRNGERFTVIESSDFSLFKRYLEREPIADIVGQRMRLGFNTLRVWLLNTSVVEGGIIPSQYPDFYERLREFCRQCPMVLDLTVFTQTQTLMPNRDEQQQHLDRTAFAVRGLPNVLLSLVNENDQHDNAVHPELIKPSGVLISRGSNGADSVPPRHDAPWDFEEYHTNDLSEWQRKVGHNAMEWADQSKRPCLATENTRYPDHDSSLIHAEDAAEGAALLCAGACFHSVNGKASRLFDATETGAAIAWVRGALSVPLEFQDGQYRHIEELEGPDCLRAYSRRLPDGQEHVITIRP